MISRRGEAEIRCNCCGKDAGGYRIGEHTFAEDVHSIKISGGYGDFCPQDLETMTFNVCGTCLKAWTEAFIVPPSITVDHII